VSALSQSRLAAAAARPPGVNCLRMLKYQTAAEKPRTIASSLPPALYQRLERLAAERDTTLSTVMRELLVKALREE
jgi:hypothetical protein